MRQRATGVLKKIYRRMSRRNTPASNNAWRVVARGTLAGLSFFLPTGRDAAWADRVIAGTYEAEMMAALGELARQGGVLYDIGAHVGVYSCAWLRLGGSRVEAFEPLPTTARVLRATLARNGFAAQVNIHNLALGASDGVSKMMVSGRDLGAVSAAFLDQVSGPDWLRDLPQFRPAAGPTVPVRCLDDLIAELDLPVPAVLKLDVEGAEALALSGAQNLLAWHKPAILCEVHTIEAGLLLAHQLTELGYQLRLLQKNNVQPATLWTAPAP